MLARTGVAFQGAHEIQYSSIGKAPGSQPRRLPFETRKTIFSIFHFSLLSWNSHWRARAGMSIRFQYLLIVHLFEEDACFLETCFHETNVFNILTLIFEMLVLFEIVGYVYEPGQGSLFHPCVRAWHYIIVIEGAKPPEN